MFDYSISTSKTLSIHLKTLEMDNLIPLTVKKGDFTINNFILNERTFDIWGESWGTPSLDPCMSKSFLKLRLKCFWNCYPGPTKQVSPRKLRWGTMNTADAFVLLYFYWNMTILKRNFEQARISHWKVELEKDNLHLSRPQNHERTKAGSYKSWQLQKAGPHAPVFFLLESVHWYKYFTVDMKLYSL